MAGRHIAAILLAAGAAFLTAPVQAQDNPPPAVTLGAPVPTSHILVFGDVAPRSPEEMRKIMPFEVRDTVALYLEGKIEQWYVQKDAQGVVFIFRAQSVDEVRGWMANLPLVKTGIMTLRFVPLGPLRPLQYLTDPVK